MVRKGDEVSKATDWLWEHGFRGVARCGSFAAARVVVSKALATEQARLDAAERALVEARDALALAQGNVDAQIGRVEELYGLVEQLTAKLEGADA